MMTYCQLAPSEQISVSRNTKICTRENASEYAVRMIKAILCRAQSA